MNAISKYIGAKSPVGALVLNLLTVYVLYSVCRLIFLACNWGLYADHLTLPYTLQMLGAGVIFDTTAILYSNVIFIVLFLLPLHIKERKGYYAVCHWAYTIVNTLCIVTNLGDCAYFPFTSKRTTMSVLSEFSHEGATGFANIMLHESVAYWYLYIIGGLMAWALWKLFRTPQCPTALSLPAYYPTQVASLAVAAGLTVIGMRGGATMATRPITISNANQYINQPIDAGIVLNTPFAIMRTLGKKPFVVPKYMTHDEAALLYSPMHTPADSSEFRPMNVVVLIVESFGKQHYGSLNKEIQEGKWQGFTPEMDSIMAKALKFRYSYANGRKSIDGMPSVLSSIPSFVEPFFLTPASLNKVSGIAGELSTHKGYTSAFFHGAMNGSMGFEAFAKSTGFQAYYGRTEYNQDPRYNGDEDFDGTWAIWDEEFLQFYADKMSELKEPFVTSVFTATSHPPFAIPQRYADIYPEESGTGTLADGTTVSEKLFRAVRYTDHALGEFFRKASRQPWFRNTLFVITADHTGGNVLPEYTTSLGMYSVPVAFYAPGMPELCGYDTTHIVNQIDIMPTVLDILHYDVPYVAFGRSAMGPADQSMAIHYVPSSGIYELAHGNWLVQADANGKLLGAYRFKEDILLKENLLGNAAYTAEVDSVGNLLKAFVVSYMERMVEGKLVYEQQ